MGGAGGEEHEGVGRKSGAGKGKAGGGEKEGEEQEGVEQKDNENERAEIMVEMGEGKCELL